MDVNREVNIPIQNPAISNFSTLPQTVQQPSPNQKNKRSTSQLIFRILGIIIAIGAIVLSLLNLLYIFIQSKDIFGILNQLIYHTQYVGVEGNIYLFQYFSSKILGTISFLLFIFLGFLIITNKSYRKRIFFVAIFLLFVQIMLSLILQIFSDRELKKSKEQHKEWVDSIQNVDRTTVTDLSTIWALKEPRLCKNITTYDRRKNCIEGFKDKSLFTTEYCIDIANEDDKNRCTVDVAKAQKDKNLCYTIPDEVRKNLCLVGVAGALKDETLCNEVSEISNLNNTCILNVGIELRDPSYCERGDNQDSKDNCYDNIATLTQNRLLCEKIKDPQYQQSCIKKVEAQIK
ncbi:hypothetical protein A2960_03455 [Candidatus Gottesmanbacteria bacterium RIFCSPLOWO2_01_FULL_39_12b]|uniref:Transmembrane protein n=1 Tax=Candidatus Gottesmanbacteria bacterium RIFCSPLOWO2_01_FULL_39_12b TaxID=1798388 RepID=A0A1F6APD4_9BACT|nr:MAG: hypothetical protein A2960_03455 [Candidatus Gottesmanbacteria bacterium RIFCSPLOWO2_01_FULL_39_12b]